MTEVAELTKGHSFGELALLGDQPRSATITCKTLDVFFAVLEREDFMSNKSFPKVSYLRKFKVFSHLQSKSLKKLSLYLFERQVPMNKIIYKEGDPPDGLYLIDNGEFEFTKSLKSNNITRSFRVSILNNGQMFGQQECITNSNRITT